METQALSTYLNAWCPEDANSQLASAVTDAASADNTAIDLGAGFAPLNNPQVSVKISAIKSSGDESYTFTLEQSTTGAWAGEEEVIGTSIALASAVAGDLDHALVTGDVFNCNRLSSRYIRLTSTLAGLLPSITYSAWLGSR